MVSGPGHLFTDAPVLAEWPIAVRILLFLSFEFPFALGEPSALLAIAGWIVFAPLESGNPLRISGAGVRIDTYANASKTTHPPGALLG